MPFHSSVQPAKAADQSLFTWQWEGGAPEPPEADSRQISADTNGCWRICLTLLGEAFTLRKAAKQGGYTFDHGFWRHIFMSPPSSSQDQTKARQLRALVMDEARRFAGGTQVSEPVFILNDSTL